MATNIADYLANVLPRARKIVGVAASPQEFWDGRQVLFEGVRQAEAWLREYTDAHSVKVLKSWISAYKCSAALYTKNLGDIKGSVKLYEEAYDAFSFDGGPWWYVNAAGAFWDYAIDSGNPYYLKKARVWASRGEELLGNDASPDDERILAEIFRVPWNPNLGPEVPVP